jgi:hypothetical protein
MADFLEAEEAEFYGVMALVMAVSTLCGHAEAIRFTLK